MLSDVQKANQVEASTKLVYSAFLTKIQTTIFDRMDGSWPHRFDAEGKVWHGNTHFLHLPESIPLLRRLTKLLRLYSGMRSVLS